MSYLPCDVSESQMRCATGDHDGIQHRGKVRDTYVCENCGKKWWYPIEYSRKQKFNGYKRDMKIRFRNIRKLINQWDIEEDTLNVKNNFQYLVLEVKSMLEDTEFTMDDIFGEHEDCVVSGCPARGYRFKIVLYGGGTVTSKPMCEYHMEEEKKGDNMIHRYYWEGDDDGE